MSSYTYSPEILEKINKVCKDPAVEINNAFAEDNLLINDIDDYLKAVFKFLGEKYDELGTIEYVIKLNLTDATSGTALTSSSILQEKKDGKNFIEINKNLAILSSQVFTDLSDTKLSLYSRNNKCLLLLVTNGLDTKLFCKGITICQINVRNPTALPKINKQTSRSARDYKYSLKDFYKIRVRNNVTKHWKNNSKRILIGGKTEDVFQVSLTNWLYENLDASRVIPKVKKISQDETDIEVIEHGGNSYLIEIKWVGKNQSKTTYNETKIESAINQVKNYLDTDKDIVEATLVVYDGRTLKEFEKIESIDEEKENWKEISKCLKQELPIKGKGFVFFLVSEPASKRKATSK